MKSYYDEVIIPQVQEGVYHDEAWEERRLIVLGTTIQRLGLKNGVGGEHCSSPVFGTSTTQF